MITKVVVIREDSWTRRYGVRVSARVPESTRGRPEVAASLVHASFAWRPLHMFPTKGIVSHDGPHRVTWNQTLDSICFSKQEQEFDIPIKQTWPQKPWPSSELIKSAKTLLAAFTILLTLAWYSGEDAANMGIVPMGSLSLETPKSSIPLAFMVVITSKLERKECINMVVKRPKGTEKGRRTC